MKQGSWANVLFLNAFLLMYRGMFHAVTVFNSVKLFKKKKTLNTDETFHKNYGQLSSH